MKRPFLILSIILILLFPVSAAFAQSDAELTLRLSRDFGYSSGTGKIQGTFSAKASGPENLVRVAFFIDEQNIGEVTEAPFRLRFITDNYPTGLHTIHAVGYLDDGGELYSNDIVVTFVSASEGWDAAADIMIPLFAIIFGILILSFVAMFVTGRKQKSLPPGTPREYGTAGGAICSRCARPFPRPFLAPNMLVGKLVRCPFCGKWAIARARSLDDLRAAEAAELAAAQGGEAVPAMSEEEKLRKELDSSRFQDL